MKNFFLFSELQMNVEQNVDSRVWSTYFIISIRHPIMVSHLISSTMPSCCTTRPPCFPTSRTSVSMSLSLLAQISSRQVNSLPEENAYTKITTMRGCPGSSMRDTCSWGVAPRSTRTLCSSSTRGACSPFLTWSISLTSPRTSSSCCFPHTFKVNFRVLFLLLQT